MDVPSFTEILNHEIWSIGLLVQVLLATSGWIFAYMAFSKLKRMAEKPSLFPDALHKVRTYADPILFPLGLCVIQWIAVAACREFHWGSQLSQAVAKFTTAWFAVRCFSLTKFSDSVKKLVLAVIYSLTLFEVLGLLNQLIQIMEGLAITLGDLRISFLSLMKGVTIFLLLSAATFRTSKWIGKKLKSSNKLDRSHQELFTKLTKVSFVTISALIALSAAGINLSAFALFGGAIGVGIGFGLQKVVSNFICGIILLLDRSIKPGDVIALPDDVAGGEGDYGEITELGARCVTVRTLTGKEHLIPNEDFITHKAENWTRSDSFLRLIIPMRASLNSDVELVLKLLLQSIKGVNRVCEDKTPNAMVAAFTESAINFELFVWMKDPENGVKQIMSDIYVNIWKLFKEHNIVIPHTQTDLYIQSINHNSSAQLEKLLKEERKV